MLACQWQTVCVGADLPISLPVLRMQCRMQMGLHPTLGGFSGPMECIRHLIKTEGTRGIFRGLSGTLTRETVGNSAFFVIYEARGCELRMIVLSRSLRQAGTMKRGLTATSGKSCALQALRRQLPGRPPPSEPPRSLSLGAVLQDSAGAITCGGIAGMAMWALVRACMRQAAGDTGACWMRH